MMARDTVPAAMSAAFASATGALPDRLLAALDAAEGEGGDVRGRQSAAMVVVPAEGEPWRRTVDLRVEDHDAAARRAAPAAHAAARLRPGRRRRRAAGRGPDRGGRRALPAGRASSRPSSDELLFWSGLARAQAGDLEGGVAAVRRAAEENPNWLVLLDRLSPEFAPAGEGRRDCQQMHLKVERAARGPGADVSTLHRWLAIVVRCVGVRRPVRRRSAAEPTGEAVNEHLLTSLLNLTV